MELEAIVWEMAHGGAKRIVREGKRTIEPALQNQFSPVSLSAGNSLINLVRRRLVNW